MEYIEILQGSQTFKMGLKFVDSFPILLHLMEGPIEGESGYADV